MTRLRALLPQVVLFTVFAVWLPLQKGASFLHPVVLGAYACLGVIFAAPATASGVSVLKAVLTGFALSWAMLITGVAAVYLRHRVVVGPDLVTLAQSGLFGVTLSAAASLVVAFLLTRTSPAAAKIAARVLLLGLLALFYFWSGWLPDVAMMGAAISAGIAAIFWMALRRAPSRIAP
jgi:hypothetical protein